MSNSDYYQRGYLAPNRRDGSGATLFMLLVLAAPALVVALALGWRPPVGPLAQVETWLAERAEPWAVAPLPAPPAEWALPDGWFYASSPPETMLTEVEGYAVTDADGIPFWSEYQRLGGLRYLGYPRSRRFASDGAVLQVFQRGVLRVQDAESGVAVVGLLDQLHAEGKDAELARRWGIPEMTLPVPGEAGPGLAADRLNWLLRDFPAFKAYLYAAPDAPALLGGPTSRVRDMGGFYALRFEGGALQQWKHEMPWAKAGSVTAANVGDIAIALGAFPFDALAPEPAPPSPDGRVR